jgi:hypothetical protein
MQTESRRQERVKSYAKVLISPGMTPGYIRDVSVTGCQVSFLQPVAEGPGQCARLSVLPGEGVDGGTFTIEMTVRWARRDGPYFSVGGDVRESASPLDRVGFRRLVEYYSSTSDPGR